MSQLGPLSSFSIFCMFENICHIWIHYHLLLCVVYVSAVVRGNELQPEVHAQPCSRTRGPNGMWWLRQHAVTDACQWWGTVPCAICGRPKYSYFDWVEYSWSWIPDQQPRCRHLFDRIGSNSSFEGIYGIKPGTGGSEEMCFRRDGCKIKGTWTSNDEVGCRGMECVDGYGVPRCHCKKYAKNTYGQRCEHFKSANDVLDYAEGIQVIVNPLVRVTEDISILVSADSYGSGFFIEISTEMENDFQWINTPSFSAETDGLVNICRTLTNGMTAACSLLEGAAVVYLIKMKFPVLRKVSQVYFYRESITPSIDHAIGYEQKIHIEAYNAPYFKYFQNKTSATKVFQTDLIVFVEYPTQIHCNLDVNIESSCRNAQNLVTPYIPFRTIKFIGEVSDSYAHQFKTSYMNSNEKLRCIENEHESTKWVLWKVMPNGGRMVLREQKLYNEFIFNIDPYTLERGLHKVEFTYSMFTAFDVRENFAVCTLNVLEINLRAIISGGYKRYVDVDTIITIDGSGSHDPNFNDDRKKSGLQYEWRCIDDQGAPCLVETLAAVARSPRKDLIKLPRQSFEPGKTYKIVLLVSKKDKPPTQATQLLITGTGIIKSLSVFCMNCISHHILGTVANPTEIIYLGLNLMVILEDGTRFDLGHEDSSWSYREEGTTDNKDASNIQVPGNEPLVFKIRENSLEKDKSYIFGVEILGTYKSEIVLYTTVMDDTICECEPKSGVRGVTLFNITCTFKSRYDDDYIFEFYDMTKEDSDYFAGRMLGSGKEFKPLRLTNGELTVYTFTASKTYDKVRISVDLSTFNETILYIRDKFQDMPKLLEKKSFEVMTQSTLLSDVLDSRMNRKLEVKKLISYLNQVRLYDAADMKLCLSSLFYILKSIMKNQYPLDFEPFFTYQISEILLRVTLHLTKTLTYKDEEYTLLDSILVQIYKPIVESSGIVLFQTRPSKPVELIDPKIMDTVQKTTDTIIHALEYLGRYLLNREMVDSEATEVKSQHMMVWVKVNTFNVWLNETKNNSIPPVKLPTSISMTLNATDVIGIHITHIEGNPFWWSKTNIVTKILLVEFCKRNQRNHDSLCEGYTPIDPFHIEYDIEKVVSSLKPIEGVTGDVHPGLSLEDLDMAITVYRLDPPFKSKLFIELVCEPSSTLELKVLILSNLRPDYLLIQEEGIIFSCNQTNNMLHFYKYDNDGFFYVGIIPNEPKVTTTRLKFKFLIFYTICYYWEVWRWGTFNCRVGERTDKSVLQCDCTHLSTFAGSVAVPPIILNPAEIIMILPIKQTTWIWPLIMLLVIICMYVILVFWARWKDRKDLKAKDVIVLKDNYPGERYAYLIGVFTGSRLHSSCDANVGIKLYGEQNESRAHILKSDDYQVFRGNSDNWFLLYCPQPLGILENLQLWHDNSGSNPDWFVETIVVVDLIDKIEYFFELNVWIALEVDEMPEVFVSPSSVQEYFSVKSVFLNNLVTGLRDTHYWTSVLWKHPRNPVTRTQRISVVMVFVMVATVTSLVLFYMAYGVSDLPEDIPSFAITNTDWFIFIVSSVVASIAACIIMFFFRKSYSHDYKMLSRSSVFLRPSEMDSRTSYFPSSSERDLMDFSKGLWDEKYVRYGVRSQPKRERTAFQNFGVALYSIIQGSSLEPIKLPRYKSSLRVNKTLLTIAWLLVGLIIVTTIVTVCSISVELLPVIREKWITIFVFVVLFDVLVFSTLKIFLFSIILSFLFLRFSPSANYNVRPRDGMARNLIGNAEYLHHLADIRTQPMYCPLSDNTSRIYREARINKMKWKLLVDFVVLILCIVFLVVLNNYHMQNQYHVNSHAENVITKGHDVQYPNFDDVYNKTTFEQFLRFNFFPGLYKFLWYNMEDPLEKDFYNARRQSWTDDCTTKLLGNGRIRQLRVIQDTCSHLVWYLEDQSKHCAPPWRPDIDDQDVYNVGWKVARYEDVYRRNTAWRFTSPRDSGSHKITGATLTTYHEGGYIMNLGYVKEEALDSITELVTKNWLDHMTRAVFVELTLINVNVGLLSQVILASEQMVTGQYLQKSQVHSLPIEMQVSTWNVFFGIFLIFFFLRMCVLMNRKGVLAYLSSAINVYEVFLLSLGFTTVILSFVYTDVMSTYIKTFQRSGIDAFFSFSEVISYINWSQGMMAFLFTFLVVRSLLSWRFGRTYYTFYYTFVLSLSWIVWLVLYFNILFLVAWRLIGYTLDIYILPYYSTFLIYYNEYQNFASHLKQYQLLVYAICFLSYLNILAFIASFLYYYRVARAHKLISTDTFNFLTFLKGKLKNIRKNRRKVEDKT